MSSGGASVDPKRPRPRSRAGASIRERIDYGFTIGTFVTAEGRRSLTSVGVLHSHRDGSVHIVPAEPSAMRAAGVPPREEVLLSVPRALLEIPTPELRFIALDIRGGQVTGRFGYDAPLDEHVRGLVALAETRLYADFASRPDMWVTFGAEHVPQSEQRTLRDGEEWFYLRHEPPADS